MTPAPDDSDDARIAALVASLEALPDATARETARALVTAVLELHAAGLGRLIALARAGGEAGRALVAAFAADALGASLLALHGIEVAEPAQPQAGFVPAARLASRR